MFTPWGRAVAALVACLSVSTEARAEWLKAETPRFVVYGDVPERDLRAYVRELEIFHEVLVRRHNGLGRAVARKLPVYLLDGDREMRQVWPQASDTVAGVYMRSDYDIFAVAAQAGGRGETAAEGRNTVRHEYVHHFQLAVAPAAYPSWLVEGYAEFYATAEVSARENKVLLGKPYKMRTDTLLERSWAPMESILDRNGKASTDLFYAQSWLLTHWFLTDNARLQQLGAYLREIAAGRTPVEALQRSTGLSPDGLEKSLKAHLKKLPYYAQDVAAFSVAEPVVTRLSEDEGDLLLLAQRTRRAHEKDVDAVKAAQSALAKFPGRRTAILSLARAQLTAGTPVEALATLKPLLKGAPDAEAAALAAYACLKRAEKPAAGETADALAAEARTYAAAAVRADPDHFPGLIQYLHARRSLPGFPTDNDLVIAERALELAPSLDGFRFESATYLEARGLYAAAYARLSPLAADPHGDELATAARARMEAIAKRLKAAQTRPAA